MTNRDYHSYDNLNSILLVELITEKYVSVIYNFVYALVNWMLCNLFLYNKSKFVKIIQWHTGIDKTKTKITEEKSLILK